MEGFEPVTTKNKFNLWLQRESKLESWDIVITTRPRLVLQPHSLVSDLKGSKIDHSRATQSMVSKRGILAYLAP